MTEFEYLLAFESILYGLLVAKFLERWNALLANRKSNRFYWPHTLLSICTILLTISRFKQRFFSPDFESIGSGFEILFNIFLPLALMYSLVYQFFPAESKEVDLKHHMESNYLIYIFGFLFFSHASIDIYNVPNYPLPFYVPLIASFFWLVPLIKFNDWYMRFWAGASIIIMIQQLL